MFPSETFKSGCNDIHMPNMDPKHQLIASVASTILQKQLNAHAGLVHQVLLGSSRTKGSDMVEAAEVFQATPLSLQIAGYRAFRPHWGDIYSFHIINKTFKAKLPSPTFSPQKNTAMLGELTWGGFCVLHKRGEPAILLKHEDLGWDLGFSCVHFFVHINLTNI